MARTCGARWLLLAACSLASLAADCDAATAHRGPRGPQVVHHGLHGQHGAQGQLGHQEQRALKGGPAPKSPLGLLTLHGDALALASGPARLPREADEAVEDNEAEATDAEEQGAQPEQQQYPDNQEAQEARHYSRRADEDNYEDEQDIVYDFSYEVKDPHTGNDFGHRQSRSGGLTQGQYRVLLPDGRMQVVDYVSDRDGFRPNIRYEDVGVAVFAGSENHEQFAEGSAQSAQAVQAAHFEQDVGPGSANAEGPAPDGQTQGPSPDEVRRRRRRRRSAPSARPSRPSARPSAPGHRHRGRH